ncbi:hypothetical protein K0A96_02450, partial [Patescibacteria group bacterium]|nr:hypothetical protein [Patescibacteria group bacterium]
MNGLVCRRSGRCEGLDFVGVVSNIAANSGGPKNELVGEIHVWAGTAAYVLGVNGQYGHYKSKNGDI